MFILNTLFSIIGRLLPLIILFFIVFKISKYSKRHKTTISNKNKLKSKVFNNKHTESNHKTDQYSFSVSNDNIEVNKKAKLNNQSSKSNKIETDLFSKMEQKEQIKKNQVELNNVTKSNKLEEKSDLPFKERKLNLKQAIILSEVLDKPVSLRN